ncbi:MAG: hypothetical protein LBR79_05005 [Oscillospiraceae bacterium]|nr:hypothetical protein [Oscillospiraceae bacterium]
MAFVIVKTFFKRNIFVLSTAFSGGENVNNTTFLNGFCYSKNLFQTVTFLFFPPAFSGGERK